jgi:hypothetical protein
MEVAKSQRGKQLREIIHLWAIVVDAYYDFQTEYISTNNNMYHMYH